LERRLLEDAGASLSIGFYSPCVNTLERAQAAQK
jgi:hypothetical protein